MSDLPDYSWPEWIDRHHYTVGTYDDELARVHHVWDKAEDGQHVSNALCSCKPVSRAGADHTFVYHEFDPEAVAPMPRD